MTDMNRIDRPRGPGPSAGSGDEQVARERPTAERLLHAIGREMPTIYRLVAFLGDGETTDDIAVGWLCALAQGPPGTVQAGKERAWVLKALLAVLGADASEGSRRDRQELPGLRPRSPMPSAEVGIAGDDLARVDDALRGLDKRTRASVLLVVHEGLSIDEGALVQGGSRRAFARRYASGVAVLDDELLDALMGRSAGRANA
jgi:DNA-directed RNA polymerase specialized sigma24 family protein